MDLKQATNPRAYFLNPIQRLKERVELTLDDVDIASNTIYVNSGSTQSSEIGSVARPFKTIQGAINNIIERGDNSMTKPYVLYVMPGVFTENVVLNSNKLVSISITSRARYLGLDAILNGSITCTQNNDEFKKLIVEGIQVGDITIEGATNDTAPFAQELVFGLCYITGQVSFKNLLTANLSGCKITQNVLYENVYSAEINGTPGHNPGGTVTVRYDSSKKKPAGADGCNIIFDNTIAGIFNIDRVGSSGYAYLQIRKGSRSAYPGATNTISAGSSLVVYDSTIRGDVTNNGSMQMMDGTIFGSVVNNGVATLSGGSYATVNWTGNAATLDQKACYVKNDSNAPGATLQDALNYLYSKTG